jgi:hypothetical protein
MTITLPADAQADLDFAAAKTGRTAESLAADAIAGAFAPYREPRLREADSAVIEAFNKADAKATKEQIAATVKPTK